MAEGRGAAEAEQKPFGRESVAGGTYIGLVGTVSGRRGSLVLAAWVVVESETTPVGLCLLSMS